MLIGKPLVLTYLYLLLYIVLSSEVILYNRDLGKFVFDKSLDGGYVDFVTSVSHGMSENLYNANARKIICMGMDH
ncbi:hypothetical protein ACHQM5_023052 [Ranunculus cassubicifolius]